MDGFKRLTQICHTALWHQPTAVAVAVGAFRRAVAKAECRIVARSLPVACTVDSWQMGDLAIDEAKSRLDVGLC